MRSGDAATAPAPAQPSRLRSSLSGRNRLQLASSASSRSTAHSTSAAPSPPTIMSSAVEPIARTWWRDDVSSLLRALRTAARRRSGRGAGAGAGAGATTRAGAAPVPVPARAAEPTARSSRGRVRGLLVRRRIRAPRTAGRRTGARRRIVHDDDPADDAPHDRRRRGRRNALACSGGRRWFRPARVWSPRSQLGAGDWAPMAPTMPSTRARAETGGGDACARGLTPTPTLRQRLACRRTRLRAGLTAAPQWWLGRCTLRARASCGERRRCS